MDDERDTSVAVPIIEHCDKDEHNPEPFLIVHGEGSEPHEEPGAFAELTLEALIGAGLLTRETRRVGEDIVRKCIEEKA